MKCYRCNGKLNILDLDICRKCFDKLQGEKDEETPTWEKDIDEQDQLREGL